jgi:hypothetical protein
MHPRFIKDISVRFGDQLVKAKPAGYAINQAAMLLKLEKPLKGAKPLDFDPAKKPPYLAVTYAQTDGVWTTDVRSLSPAVTVTRSGREFLAVPSYCVIVDSEGVPVGMSMNDEIPLDESWKGSPLKWPAVSSEQMKEALEKLEKSFNRGVFLVKLNFRSPKKTSRYSPYESDEGATERHVLGGLIDPKTILVVADMKPKVTARLERITVSPGGQKPLEAKFKCTLKDYGALVATLERPLEDALDLYDGKITDFRNKLLLAAQVKIEGEKCTTYFLRNRVVSFNVGWKRRLFPEVRGSDDNLLLFDTRGRLVAFPIARREKVSVSRYYRGGYPRLTPAAHMVPVSEDLAKHADPSNVPLTEEQENRLAWLGVVMQPLNTELARENKVSHLTRDGSIGGLVSYIYSDSPAAESGIRVGDVLIRIHVEDEPKPIDINVSEHGYGGMAFPWHKLDEVPEQYYDRIPRPWPSAENGFTRALTDLGFGKKFVLEMSREGEVLRKEFAVVESPPHHDTAKKHKSEALGLTVKDLTYEVRRYFQKKSDDPGVICSKIEPGSKASVAKIKPYEIITHINEKPVKTVKDFEKLVAEGGELRLSVKRMTKGRVVKIKMDSSATTKPAPKAE